MTSNLRHHYVACASNDGTLYFFSVTLNVKMNCARNYENMLNFVKVMPKVLLVPFFPDTVYLLDPVHVTNLCCVKLFAA